MDSKVERFENGDEKLKKRHILSFLSAFSGVLQVWTIDENVLKSMSFQIKRNQYGQVETKRTPSVVENILLRFLRNENGVLKICMSVVMA